MTADGKHDYTLTCVRGTELAEHLYFEQLIETYNPGSFGRAFRILCRRHHSGTPIQAVIKVLSTNPDPQKQAVAEAEFETERAIIGSLDFPGISQMLGYGKVKVRDPHRGGDHDAEFLCSIYVKDSMSLADLMEQSRSPAQVDKPSINPLLLADALLVCLNTIAQVHELGAVHFDLHPGNILIAPEHRGYFWRSRQSVLIDFGKAYWPLIGKPPSAAKLPSFMSQAQKDNLILNDGKYTPQFLQSSGARLADLHALGYSFEQACSFVPRSEQRSSGFRALKEAIDTLKNPAAIDPVETMTRSRNGLAVLTHQEFLFPAVRIRTFTSRSSEIPREILRLVDTPAFQRQRKVYQLGMTQHVYPGATHTRFVHSLGVLDLANQYVGALRSNNLKFATEYTASKHVSLLAYALLHDVGHYPFAHYLEEMQGTDLPEEIRSVVHHEKLGQLRYTPGSELADPVLCDALHKLRIGYSEESFDELLGNPHRTLWGQIIDGPLDADKLDYLIRDGAACGVPYAAAIDVERLISSLTAVKMEDQLHLGISGKAVAPAAELLIARYHMYNEVYFHKVCRSIAACIKKAFWLSCKEGLVTRANFLCAAERMDDEAFLEWLADLVDQLPETPENKRAAALVRTSLVSGERQLYKRATTLFDAYASEAPTEAAAIQRCAGLGMAQLDDIEERLAAHFALQLGMDVPKLLVLLDVPLREGKDVMLPYVQDSLGRTPKALDDVSPVCSGIKESLRRSRKIRLFLAPEVHERVTHKWSVMEIKKKLVQAVMGDKFK